MTGICQKCGPVELRYKHDKNKKFVRCGVAMLQKGAKKHSFALSIDEAQLLLRKKCCDICGSTKRLHIDHDHQTKKARGVLCSLCNIGLGLFRDSPKFLTSASRYLRKRTRTST